MTNESVELKAHKRIWLQQEGETTWCQDKINDDDIEYVLATPPQSPEAKQYSYWWCHNCKTEVDNTNVTFEEKHDSCGHPVIVCTGLSEKSPEAKIAEGLKGINIKKLSRKTADKLQGKNGWDYQPTDVRDVLNTLLAVCETDKE